MWLRLISSWIVRSIQLAELLLPFFNQQTSIDRSHYRVEIKCYTKKEKLIVLILCFGCRLLLLSYLRNQTSITSRYSDKLLAIQIRSRYQTYRSQEKIKWILINITSLVQVLLHRILGIPGQ